MLLIFPQCPVRPAQVVAAMPLGGIPYSSVTAYTVIRTAVTVGAMDKAEYYAAAMAQRQVGWGRVGCCGTVMGCCRPSWRLQGEHSLGRDTRPSLCA